ncbi:MAG TPA: hypothetical protein VM513_11560 [Kofleriaceae bacterium]|nr:hypothetical protein [Kofleriaceae bacterium]
MALVVFAACGSPDHRLEDGLNNLALGLERELDRLEQKTAVGQPCYPVADGYYHHEIPDFGHDVAKTRRDLEVVTAYAAIYLDVYKTEAGPRFDRFAKRYNAWLTGPHARALDGCKRCIDDLNGADVGSCAIR